MKEMVGAEGCRVLRLILGFSEIKVTKSVLVEIQSWTFMPMRRRRALPQRFADLRNLGFFMV